MSDALTLGIIAEILIIAFFVGLTVYIVKHS